MIINSLTCPIKKKQHGHHYSGFFQLVYAVKILLLFLLVKHVNNHVSLSNFGSSHHKTTLFDATSVSAEVEANEREDSLRCLVKHRRSRHFNMVKYTDRGWSTSYIIKTLFIENCCVQKNKWWQMFLVNCSF